MNGIPKSAGWQDGHIFIRCPGCSQPMLEGTYFRSRMEALNGGWSTLRNLPSIPLQEGQVHVLENLSGTCFHLHVAFKRGGSHAVSLLVRRAPDGQEQTAIRYEWETGRLTLDRSRSSLDSQVQRDTLQETYFPPAVDVIQLEVFLDRSVLEVFIDRRSAFAAAFIPP